MSDTPLRDMLLTLDMSPGGGAYVPVSEEGSDMNLGEILLARYGYGIADWLRNAKGSRQTAWLLELQLRAEGFERPGAPS